MFRVSRSLFGSTWLQNVNCAWHVGGRVKHTRHIDKIYGTLAPQKMPSTAISAGEWYTCRMSSVPLFL